MFLMFLMNIIIISITCLFCGIVVTGCTSIDKYNAFTISSNKAEFMNQAETKI